MSVSPEQAQMLRRSFGQLRENLAPASLAFYEDLFDRAPALRSLFRDDIAGQGMKFMTTLGIILDGIEHGAETAGRVAALGAGHRLMGVKAEHFAPMGEALIATLRVELGEDFTPELEVAWRRAYTELSQAIMAEGGIS